MIGFLLWRVVKFAVLLTVLSVGVLVVMAAVEKDTPDRATNGQGLVDKAKRDAVVTLPKGDAVMADAMRRAKATLPTFLAVEKARPADAKGFAVKVGVHQGGNVEYFWITPFEAKRGASGGAFSGIVSNAPRSVTTVKAGQRITFAESEIVDWMYIERGKMKGNYTACALLKKAPKQEGDAMKKQYGLECDL